MTRSGVKGEVSKRILKRKSQVLRVGITNRHLIKLRKPVGAFGLLAPSFISTGIAPSLLSKTKSTSTLVFVRQNLTSPWRCKIPKAAFSKIAPAFGLSPIPKESLRRLDQLFSLVGEKCWIRRKAGQQNLLEMLRRKGFVVRTRQVKFIKQNNGTYFMKGDCDALVSMDMWRVAHTYDTAVLMSGDSDFADVVKMLRRDLKKNVIVISTKKHISRELLQAANKYINLKKFKKEFAGTGKWANGWYKRPT